MIGDFVPLAAENVSRTLSVALSLKVPWFTVIAKVSGHARFSATFHGMFTPIQAHQPWFIDSAVIYASFHDV